MQPEGVRFGRYWLVEKLGSGGMAVVYRALLVGPEGFSREVVVKRILAEQRGTPALSRAG